MVATELPSSPEMQQAACIATAQQAAGYLSQEHATAVNSVLMDLMSAPAQAQEKSMNNALAQASAAIDLSSLNISMQESPSTEVRVATATNNIDKGHDGIA